MRIRYVNDFGVGAYSTEVDFTPFELASAPVFTANTGKKTPDGLSVEQNGQPQLLLAVSLFYIILSISVELLEEQFL